VGRQPGTGNVGVAGRGYKTVTATVEKTFFAGGAPLQWRVFVGTKEDRATGVARAQANSAGLGVQGVTRGADGADHVGMLLAVQRDAQAADVDVDGARST